MTAYFGHERIDFLPAVLFLSCKSFYCQEQPTVNSEVIKILQHLLPPLLVCPDWTFTQADLTSTLWMMTTSQFFQVVAHWHSQVDLHNVFTVHTSSWQRHTNVHKCHSSLMMSGSVTDFSLWLLLVGFCKLTCEREHLLVARFLPD